MDGPGSDLHAALKRGADPIIALRGVFDGWTALVVSAGPSARRWREIYDSLDPSRVVIFCVKQAIELDGLDTLTAVHLCNSWNLRRYRYDAGGIARLFVDDAGSGPSYQKWDATFRLRKIGGIANAVAVTRDFEGWTLDATGLDRPWGPGIMYEAMFHILVHCGVAAIHTIGWDIADVSGANSHFYDKAGGAPDAETGRRPSPFGRARRRFGNWWAFRKGEVYNKAGMIAGEAELVASAVPALRQWLEGRGISLHIHSDSHWLKPQAITG